MTGAGRPLRDVTCPCGEQLTLGEERIIEDGAASLVVISGGTFWPHMRDAHPAAFAEACAMRARLNKVLGRRMGAMPRDVDGTLLAGRRVGDLGQPPSRGPGPGGGAGDR